MAEDHPQASRILLIEGSSYFVRLFAGWAGELGYEQVRHASDTRRAWSLLLSERFDLVVCDRSVGPDDGLELMRLLRLERESPNRFVPIVFIAAASTRRLVELARDCGISEFLAKPVSRKAFMEHLKAIAERPRNFIKAGVYFGPDRRRRAAGCKGEDRRRREPEKISATHVKDHDTVLI